MDTPPPKRPSPLSDDGPLAKKLKTLVEEPELYSDAVRKKLAATSRTGQACDRCKERKMKCDTDPSACQPCRQKSLRCYTTDRVTGQARERGELDRTESELSYLRDQLAAYQHKFGLLHPTDASRRPPTDVSPVPLSRETQPPLHSPAPPPTSSIPDSHYVGWPSPGFSEPLRCGPVSGTKVNVMDGTIDITDWPCEMMDNTDPNAIDVFNLSWPSILNTIMGYQRIKDPKLPPKEDGLKDANHFLVIMSQYVPIVHRPTFIDLVNRFYDHPDSVSPSETALVVMVFAILAHQTAIRNHQHSAEKFEDCYRYLHYALGFYRELFIDTSIPSMQAMTLMMLQFRNLPKPGVSWMYSHKVLVRAIELNYHRDPDKIKLPPGEDDPLSKELRKRIFHSMLGICVTTGCRVGLPAPWQFQHIDLPLPRALKDSEISKTGIISDLSGQCDFWPCIHLAKLLPLLTELHNHVHAVRKPAPDYIRTLDALNTKITAWKQDWDDSIKAEPRHVNLVVATLLFETWTAEYQLNLYHPACCTSDDPDIQDRNLEMCLKASRRLLQTFHVLSSKYKGVDFTWHSTSAYATGFGITLHYYRKRLTRLLPEQFESMRNELNGWVSLMAYADLVLRTGNHLQRQFQPRVQTLEDDYRRLMLPSSAPTSSPTPANFSILNGTGPALPHLKQESNGISPATPKPYPDYHSKSLPLPQPGLMHPNGCRPQSQPQPTLNGNHTPQIRQQHQWPFQMQASSFSKHPHSSPSSLHRKSQSPASPLYPPPAFPLPQSPLSASASHPIPTSLASLLNDSGKMYVNYPTPPQSQHSLPVNSSNGGTVPVAGPTASMGIISDVVMDFSPNHYFDSPGTPGWPLIAMPPGQQL